MSSATVWCMWTLLTIGNHCMISLVASSEHTGCHSVPWEDPILSAFLVGGGFVSHMWAQSIIGASPLRKRNSALFPAFFLELPVDELTLHRMQRMSRNLDSSHPEAAFQRAAQDPLLHNWHQYAINSWICKTRKTGHWEDWPSKGRRVQVGPF